jgi:hypothetical protein
VKPTVASAVPDDDVSVARYLAAHPDFFARHPELLAGLTLSHYEAGSAVSLIERQVRLLRERSTGLANELQELVEIARQNDLITTRLHRFAVSMIEAATLDEVLDTARDMLRQEFALDATAVLLMDTALDGTRRECIAGSDALAQKLLALAGSEPRARLGTPLDELAREALFGSVGGALQSTALMPFPLRSGHGVLVLGSRDPLRFQPGLGSVYLERLGELLAAGVQRRLP